MYMLIPAHLIAGLLPVDHLTFSWFWFFGSVIPDLDHIYVLFKHSVPLRKVFHSMRFEHLYGINFRTKYMHSVLGGAILSLSVLFFGWQNALVFAIAYGVHLILDLPDKDIKEYLYPLRLKFRGLWPLFSLPEKIFTGFLFLVVVYMYF